MPDIEFKLRGNGFYQSADDFTLSLTADAGRYWFTLHGRKAVTPDDDRVQFDFNDMTRAELEELHCAIGLILDEPNAGAVPRRGSDVGTSPLLGSKSKGGTK